MSLSVSSIDLQLTLAALQLVSTEVVDSIIFVRYFECPGLEDKLRISVGTEEENQVLIEALRTLLF